jgi:hypothetical protein
MFTTTLRPQTRDEIYHNLSGSSNLAASCASRSAGSRLRCGEPAQWAVDLAIHGERANAAHPHIRPTGACQGPARHSDSQTKLCYTEQEGIRCDPSHRSVPVSQAPIQHQQRTMSTIANISPSLNLHIILKAALERTLAVLGMESGCIYLLDPDDGCHQGRAAPGARCTAAQAGAKSTGLRRCADEPRNDPGHPWITGEMVAASAGAFRLAARGSGSILWNPLPPGRSQPTVDRRGQNQEGPVGL